jgi:predicted DNA-binding helix-hairpin-helix protein
MARLDLQQKLLADAANHDASCASSGAMLREMPKKYWKNMPGTALVGELVGRRARRGW